MSDAARLIAPFARDSIECRLNALDNARSIVVRGAPYRAVRPEAAGVSNRRLSDIVRHLGGR